MWFFLFIIRLLLGTYEVLAYDIRLCPCSNVTLEPASVRQDDYG